MVFRLLGIILLILLMLPSFTVSAEADVISKATLFHALDSTPQLRRGVGSLPYMSSDHPFYSVIGTGVGGYIFSAFDDYGFLSSGKDLLIVPLGSGGSGGVFYTLLYTSIGNKLRFIGYIPSPRGHLDVHIFNGDIVVETPIYRENDANCCPSSHEYKIYTIEGLHLKLIP